MTKITAKIITFKKDKDIIWINTYRNQKRSSRIGVVKDELEAILKALFEYKFPIQGSPGSSGRDLIEDEERCEDCGHKPYYGGVVKDQVGSMTITLHSPLKKKIKFMNQDPIEDEERCEDCGHKPCDGGSYYCKAD